MKNAQQKKVKKNGYDCNNFLSRQKKLIPYYELIEYSEFIMEQVFTRCIYTQMELHTELT